jgi:hypothetical protein
LYITEGDTGKGKATAKGKAKVKDEKDYKIVSELRKSRVAAAERDIVLRLF